MVRDLDRSERAALDRHITGNSGEDQDRSVLLDEVYGLIELADAHILRAIFADAADRCSLWPVEIELRRRFKEWDRAIDDVDQYQGSGIVLAGMVVAGMQVPGNQRVDWMKVIRHTVNDSLQLDNGIDDRPVYRSYIDRTSPVVVRVLL